MTSGTVLVTGATGFTGGHLARRLILQGLPVRALVRDPERAGDLAERGIELIKGDLTEPQSLDRALAGVKTVYHIAASFREENISVADMWAVNRDGVRNMLEASVAAGTVERFVHCSTIGVHGNVENPPAVEESPFAPGDHYQDSKLAGEQVANQYMHEQRLPVTIFRPGGIYGPGDTRFLKLFRPIKNGRFIMIGSGQVMYTLIHIEDLVDGILLCGTVPEAIGETFILTGEPAITLNEFVRTIAEVLEVKAPRLRVPVAPVYMAGYLCEILCKPLGVEPPLYRRRVDFFRKDRSFSIAKARRILGYSPKIGLQEGLDDTARWYAEQGLL